MAAALIAIIVALVLGHVAPQLAALRRFGWFDAWQEWLGGQAGDAMRSRFGILLSVGLPVALMALLQSLMATVAFGFGSFVLAVLVLFWCWGPRDLDLDVEAVLDAPDRQRRREAAEALLGHEPSGPLNGRMLVEAVFRGGLRRWFAVLLWFVLLGPAGALLYRLAQRAAARGARGADGAVGADGTGGARSTVGVDGVDGEDGEDGAEHAAIAVRLRDILEWPVAQLMVLSLALVANFDAVLATWRAWHAARGGWLVLDTGFLGAVARACVASELEEQAEELQADEALAEEAPVDAVAGDVGDANDPTSEPPPLLELRDAMSLVWRVLLLWLTVLAVVVLAGY